MKIGFHTSILTERGTEVAVFDYAFYNQKLLGNESVVFVQSSNQHEPSVLEKFKQNFQPVMYDNSLDFETKAGGLFLDAVYFLKSGERSGTLIPGIKNIVHAVFPQPLNELHGDVYAFISEWLSKEYSNYKVPFVPHIISLPDHNRNLRDELNIPLDATVFGCYGGGSSFDLEFVRKVVSETSELKTHIYFVFMNIPAFCENDRVRFLPRNTDLNFKVAFINTCDAMLHARSIGESFGLACGEFSIRNKPVFTYGKCPQRSQIDILGDKAILYEEETSLRKVLQNFDRIWASKQQWDCYSQQFSPESVMRQFADVFLEERFSVASVKDHLGLGDRAFVKYCYLKRKLRHHSKKWAR